MQNFLASEGESIGSYVIYYMGISQHWVMKGFIYLLTPPTGGQIKIS